jgi:hypothetical protein
MREGREVPAIEISKGQIKLLSGRVERYGIAIR